MTKLTSRQKKDVAKIYAATLLRQIECVEVFGDLLSDNTAYDVQKELEKIANKISPIQILSADKIIKHVISNPQPNFE